jgi:hypothetical protein
MEYWLSTSPWVGLILWVILYISDYYFTLYSAHGFRQIEHFQFEIFELTPQYQKEVMALKPVSRLHITLLILYSLLLLLIWWLTKRLALLFPHTYLLYLGMFILIEVAVHFRHLRNVSLIREIKKNGGVDGQIFYQKWFSYRISAAELYTFSVFFLIVAVLYTSSFFLGGAIMCLGTGIQHSRLAKKAKLTPTQASQA